MGMSVESAHSVRVFEILSSHLPNMGILYINILWFDTNILQ